MAMSFYKRGHLLDVREDLNECHFIAFDNEYIRSLVSFDLDDDDCDEVAAEIACHFADFAKTWATELRVDHPVKHDGCFVGATLVRQQWVNDYAMEVGEVEFDCFLALEQYKLSELPPYADDLHEKGCLNYGDELFWASSQLGLVSDWDGPFELYVDSDDYERYMDERVQREYGYEIEER